jgi:hypothetical protein
MPEPLRHFCGAPKAIGRLAAANHDQFKMRYAGAKQ